MKKCYILLLKSFRNLFERHEINYERSNGALLSGNWQGKKGYVNIETLPFVQDNLFEETKLITKDRKT